MASIARKGVVMGVRLSKSEAAKRFAQWTEKYDVYAPMLMEGEGCFSDTDVIRYGKVSSLDDIVWDKKSDYSFKETLLPINETLFYYTEDQTTVPKGPQKGLLIFLRSCDLHAVKRLDDIYLNNKFEDFYYARIRERAKFILMGCETSCQSGFCVSMGTNQNNDYDAYMKVDGDTVYADVKCDELKDFTQEGIPCDVTPDYVTENIEKVTNPGNKTIQRIYDKTTGKIRADLICLEDETFDPSQDMIIFDPMATWKKTKIYGGTYTLRELLVPVFQKGRCVYTSPSVMEIRDICQKEMNTLWDETRRLVNPQEVYVDLSDKLYKIKTDLLEQMGQASIQ